MASSGSESVGLAAAGQPAGGGAHGVVCKPHSGITCVSLNANTTLFLRSCVTLGQCRAFSGLCSRALSCVELAVTCLTVPSTSTTSPNLSSLPFCSSYSLIKRRKGPGELSHFAERKGHREGSNLKSHSTTVGPTGAWSTSFQSVASSLKTP
jgi:hypothetical protein